MEEIYTQNRLCSVGHIVITQTTAVIQAKQTKSPVSPGLKGVIRSEYEQGSANQGVSVTYILFWF